MPEAFAVGPLLIPTRIAAFVVALLVAMCLASRLAKRWGLDTSWTRHTIEGSVVVGLIAARLAYVALYWEAFSPAPWTALYFWQPGYLPVAGLAGGALYVLYRLRAQSAAERLSSLRAVSSGLAVGATILAAVLGTMNLASDPGVLRAGDKVPDFELADLNGDRVAFSDLEGKGVVLNLWATWCPPCRREMPLLQSVWEEYQARNVVVVGIDVGEPPDVVRRFVDSMGISYPIWTDPRPADENAADTNKMLGWFGSAGLPTTIFIRPDGVIHSVYLGELNRALLQERLPELVPE